MCNVSESYKARNNKNRRPNEDAQEFWEEGSGNIHIDINESPNTQGGYPEGHEGRHYSEAGRVRGPPKSAAPKSELENMASRELQRRRRRGRKGRLHKRGYLEARRR
eukprot:6772886-Pyramimonas_sp.AAC.1